MTRAFPTCTECRGIGLAAQQLYDMKTPCQACDGAGVDIYAHDARLVGSSRPAVRFMDSELTDVAWKEASASFPEVNYADLPEGWTDADGERLYRSRTRLTVAILEREGSPAVTYARASFGFPLAPATRFPRTPWMRPWVLAEAARRPGSTRLGTPAPGSAL